MRDLDELFEALRRSSFRRRFRLTGAERLYLRRRGEAVVLTHARGFLRDRLAPANPVNEGRQTPWRGHPAFVAQHATGTCCRSCLRKWHHIPRGRPMSPREVEHALAAIRRWLRGQDRTAHEDFPRLSEPTLFDSMLPL